VADEKQIYTGFLLNDQTTTKHVCNVYFNESDVF
jgi:hypothetical protein